MFFTGDHARILVVDDEPAILNLISRALAARGHDVLRATGPLQALELGTHAPPVDLVVSDVNMPVMQGTELVRRITDVYPGTKVILMSGYVPSSNLPPDVPFIRKPFPIGKLVGKVEEVLALSMKLEAGVNDRKMEPVQAGVESHAAPASQERAEGRLSVHQVAVLRSAERIAEMNRSAA